MNLNIDAYKASLGRGGGREEVREGEKEGGRMSAFSTRAGVKFWSRSEAEELQRSRRGADAEQTTVLSQSGW